MRLSRKSSTSTRCALRGACAARDRAEPLANAAGQIRLGRCEIDTWYFSPYPDDHGHCSLLYICEFCLKYMKYAKTYEQHRGRCTVRQPPGDEIYRRENLSVFEVDSVRAKVRAHACMPRTQSRADELILHAARRTARTYVCWQSFFSITRPSTLTSNRFSFMFSAKRIAMVRTLSATSPRCDGCTVRRCVWYCTNRSVAQEKESPEKNNLACILTLPPHQRKGYGKLLISLSTPARRNTRARRMSCGRDSGVATAPMSFTDG